MLHYVKIKEIICIIDRSGKYILWNIEYGVFICHLQNHINIQLHKCLGTTIIGNVLLVWSCTKA